MGRSLFKIHTDRVPDEEGYRSKKCLPCPTRWEQRFNRVLGVARMI